MIGFLVTGEVSLPGGKAEEGDEDDGETATREAKEEIGLDPSLVDVVTIIEPFLSKVLKDFLCMLSYFVSFLLVNKRYMAKWVQMSYVISVKFDR